MKSATVFLISTLLATYCTADLFNPINWKTSNKIAVTSVNSNQDPITPTVLGIADGATSSAKFLYDTVGGLTESPQFDGQMLLMGPTSSSNSTSKLYPLQDNFAPLTESCSCFSLDAHDLAKKYPDLPNSDAYQLVLLQGKNINAVSGVFSLQLSANSSANGTNSSGPGATTNDGSVASTNGFANTVFAVIAILLFSRI